MPSDEAAFDRRASGAAVEGAASTERASPPWAVAALVAANALPLVGVLFWGWSTFDLMLLYWFENGVIGAATALKMLLTRGADGRAPTGAGVVGKLFFIAFFTAHYGAFWSAHGFFVVALFGDGGVFAPGPAALGGSVLDGPAGFFSGGVPIAERYLSGGLLWSALALVASHGVSFVGNVLQRGEDLRTALPVLMARPYARVFVLHITLVLGAFLIVGLGEPIAALVLFVALKTGVDLGAHLRAHRSRPAGRVPGEGAVTSARTW